MDNRIFFLIFLAISPFAGHYINRLFYKPLKINRDSIYNYEIKLCEPYYHKYAFPAFFTAGYALINLISLFNSPIILFFLLCMLVYISFTDFISFVVPEKVTIFFILSGLIYRFYTDAILNLNSGILYFAFFLFFYWLGLYIIKRPILGFADVMLSMALGLFLGDSVFKFTIFIISSLFLAQVYIFIIRKATVPFTPFMALGFMIAFLIK